MGHDRKVFEEDKEQVEKLEEKYQERVSDLKMHILGAVVCV